MQGGTDRKACRANIKECVTSCGGERTTAPESGSSCQGQCGTQLSQCLRDASAGLPACIDTCPKGSGRNQCVAACQEIVASAMEVCQEQHQSCLGSCAGATTTSTLATSTTTVTTPSSSTTSSSSTTFTSTTTTTSTSVSGLCGNGVIDPGETCDPPGQPAGPNGNECRVDCTMCGDSITQVGETCDDGNSLQCHPTRLSGGCESLRRYLEWLWIEFRAVEAD